MLFKNNFRKEVWQQFACEVDMFSGFWFLQDVKYYSDSQKPGHSTLAHNFAKYWPIIKILYRRTQQWLCNELITKDTATP